MVAPELELVPHVEGAYDAQVHIHELGGEVEVALEVGCIDDVDDDVRRLLGKVPAHVQLLGRVA